MTPSREWPGEQKFIDGDSPFSSCRPARGSSPDRTTVPLSPKH